LTAALAVVMQANLARSDSSEPAADIGVSFDTDHTVTNWSATHRYQPHKIYFPKYPQDVCRETILK